MRKKLYAAAGVCVFLTAQWQTIVTAGEKPSSPKSITQTEANRLVNDYYAGFNQRDVAAIVSKFSDRVSYTDDQQHDREFIEKDVRDYLAHWPSVNFKPGRVVVSANPDGTATLTFNVDYSLANKTAGTSPSGQSENIWGVQRFNGDLKIISQREDVHPSKRSAVVVAEARPKKSHEDEEALSDDELKKQPQIELPIATSPAAKTRPKAAAKDAKDLTIAVDIGHTPLKGGAISARGVFEYKFNLRLASELFAELQSIGFMHAYVINPEGDEIRLAQRSADANARDADLFIAIHHDSVKDRFLKNWEVNGEVHQDRDDFHGYSIFFSNKNPRAADSLAFAELLGEALLKAGFTPTLHHAAQENRPIIDKAKGIYAFDDLVVLKTARMPAALLECGVIVNRAEEEKLNNAAYRGQIVHAIGTAIGEFAARQSKKK